MKLTKNLLMCLLSLGIITGLSGCSSSEPAKNTETQIADQEQEAQTGEVEAINLDNSEGTLKFTNYEITTDYEGNPAIIVYYDYTNKKDETSFAQMTFYPQVFQNGIECEMAFTMNDNESLSNSSKEIQKGTTLNIAYIYKLQDTQNSVTIQVTDQSAENLLNDITQTQEITLV